METLSNIRAEYVSPKCLQKKKSKKVLPKKIENK